MEYSYILGPLFLICFFIISLITVAGIKSVIIAVKSKFAPQKPIAAKKPAPATKKPKIVKSVEINPDEVDKIYVKRVS